MYAVERAASIHQYERGSLHVLQQLLRKCTRVHSSSSRLRRSKMAAKVWIRDAGGWTSSTWVGKKGGSTYPLFSHDCENQGQVAVLKNKSGIALKLSKWWWCLLIFISATIKTSLRVETTMHLASKHSDRHNTWEFWPYLFWVARCVFWGSQLKLAQQ